MVSTSLDLNITTLEDYTIEMMEKCELILLDAFECMINKDLNKVQDIIKRDDEIDKLREYIRDKSIELMVLRQPMAIDLRRIYSLGHIAIELERIGDYIVNICEETIKIGEEKYIKELVDIPKMYKVCKEMLLGVRACLENEDEDLARDIALKDDEVDRLYEMVQNDCLKIMNDNPSTINQGVGLLFIGRSFERIGDHITNISEKIIYAINGEMIEIG